MLRSGETNARAALGGLRRAPVVSGLVVFISLAALSLCIAFASASDNPNLEPDKAALSAPPSEPEGPELEGKRTATSQTFLLPDGGRETRIFDTPVNYRDANGDWKPVDEALNETADGKLVNGANSFDLQAPTRMGAGSVRLTDGDKWVSYRLLGPGTEPAELNDEAASYESSDPGTDFIISGLANGVKELIELADPSQPSRFDFELDASQGLTPVLAEDGSLDFRDAADEIFAHLPAPTISDSSQDIPIPTNNVSYDLHTTTPGHWRLAVVADEAWLADVNRVWPVRIDPTVTLASSSVDCTFGSLPAPNGWSGCGSTGSPNLLAAYSQKENQPVHSYLRFNLNSIPSTAYVANAAMSLNSPAVAENTTAVQVRRATKTASTKLNWTRYAVDDDGPSLLWTTPGGDFTSEGTEILTSQRGAQAGWWNFNSTQLTNLVQQWVGSGILNQGVIVKNSNESKAECEANSTKCNRRYVEFSSSAATNTSLRPSLAVTYYPAAPAGSKITSPKPGTRTARRLRLKVASDDGGATGVTFQFRDVDDHYQTIPTNLVQTAQGQPVSWPMSIQGVESKPIYFDAAHASNLLQKQGGGILIRALFEGPANVAGYSDPVSAIVDRSVGGTRDAGTSVGPGKLNLLTGNFTISRTDVSIAGFGSALEFSRSHSSRDVGAGGDDPVKPGDRSLLGRGWIPNAPVEAAGSEWRSIKTVTATPEEIEEGLSDYALLTDSEGYESSFYYDGTNYVSPPAMTDFVLVREGSTWYLTDPAGNRTTFKNNPGTVEYLPDSVIQPGENKTQMIYKFNGDQRRLTMVVAPSVSEVECTEGNATTTLGCRALTFSYKAASTWKAPATFGDRLASITYFGPASASSMGQWEVANYNYNPEGRLVGEWDPRVSPKLEETYAYTSEGQLQTLTPPGEQPWTFEYGFYDGEQEGGRLTKVKRASLLASPTIAQTTISYGVPLSGTPYNMSSSAVAQWGQQNVPFDATAIFPPDQIPSTPPSSYSNATIYYMDGSGAVVNTATPLGAGTSAPSVTTSETDEYGNVIRELTAQNRLRALAAGANSVVRSHELETKRTYSDDGTEMKEEFGPLHQIRLESGATPQARAHRVVQYDLNAPPPPWGTPKPHLPTRETTDSISSQGTVADQRVTDFKYNWTLRLQTDVIVDPAGLNLRTHTFYDDDSGLPISRSLPANPNGGDAHTTSTVYYSAATNAIHPSCGNKPAWANLPCKITPAAQPGTAGQPPLVVKTIAIYNALSQPVDVRESPGEETTTRQTVMTYDAAGRLLAKSQSGGGSAIPKSEIIYDKTSGRPVTERFDCNAGGCVGGDDQALTTTYDSLGRPTSYLDADGGSSSITYDLLSRPVTTSDGKGTQTRTYDPITGLLTELQDSAAGKFTASYNADGAMTDQGFPNGLVATTTFDETGAAVHLSYVKTTMCSINCTWLDINVEKSIYGQVLSQTSTLSKQQFAYDKAGRLFQTFDTPQGGSCTTRSYSFDADSNRTKLVTRAPGIGGACDTTSTGTLQDYKYDAADRLTDTGITYDNFGRIANLPAADAGGKALSTSYFSNEIVSSQSQGGVTNTFQLDAQGRQRQRLQAGGLEGTEVFHYAGPSDTPTWTARGALWSRSIVGISGELAAIQDSSTGVALQLTNLHGDVIGTASLSQSATKPTATFESDEFGNPKQGSSPRFGWLGGKQRRTELSSGVIQMGVRSYVPSIGRFLSTDPVRGGSANAYDYANADPVNSFDLSGQKPYDSAVVGPCEGNLHVYSPRLGWRSRGGYGKFYARYRISCGATGYIVSVLKVTRVFQGGPVEIRSERQPGNASGPHWNGEWGNWDESKPATSFDCLAGVEYEYTYEIQIQWASVAGVVVVEKGSPFEPGSGSLTLSAREHCGHGRY